MDMQSLMQLQALPLDVKIGKTKLRIMDAIRYFGHEGLYISFSGGKDSTVLHHICKELEMELWGEMRIPRVFCNTTLEYPEVVAHAKTIATDIIRPKKVFKEVLTDYGYPIISKASSFAIRKLTKMNLTDKYRSKLLHGDEKGTMGKLANKHHYLLDADFDVSEQCCDVMKKQPFHKYEKLTGRIPMVGVMASESTTRRMRYIKDGGCNAFETNKPQSKPIGFWKDQDVLQYIDENNIPIPSVYGEITKVWDEKLDAYKYSTQGLSRTGCMFCMIGVKYDERNNNRFQQMQETHPRLHEYCIGGGEYDEDGRWKPNKDGLGLGHILETLGHEHSKKIDNIEFIK